MTLDRSKRNVDAEAEDDEYYVETPNTIGKPGRAAGSGISALATAPVFGDIALPDDYNIYQIPKHPCKLQRFQELIPVAI